MKCSLIAVFSDAPAASSVYKTHVYVQCDMAVYSEDCDASELALHIDSQHLNPNCYKYR